jgi:uncharacterized protein
MIFVYGISGLAVNHMADWNPNYIRHKELIAVEPFTATTKDNIITEAKSKLHLSSDPKNYFRSDPSTVQLFYESMSYIIDLPTGNVVKESTPKRLVLYEMNQLHVNAIKGSWTLVADVFAVSLIFMALSGMFVLKGKVGLTGRGKWLVALGAALPAAYWIIFFSE